MGVPTGLQCKAYYNTGTQGTPVWAEADIIINLDVKRQYDTIEGSCRKSGGLKQYGLGQRDDEITFNICHNNADDVWDFFRSAFEDKDVIHFRVMDGDQAVGGTDGQEGTYYISGNDETQPLSGNVEDSLTLKPSNNGLTASDSPIAPVRVTIT